MKILTYIGIRSAFLFTFVISYIEYKKGVDYMCNNPSFGVYKVKNFHLFL